MKGLYLQPNTFAVPAGAMETALNVVCAYDGVSKKRRGFYDINTPTTDCLGLFVYLDRIINIQSNKISNLNGGTETSNGSVSVTTVTPRAAQSNGNFYFTTNFGVFNIENITDTARSTGVPPALELNGRLLTGYGTTPIKGDPETVLGTQVAYRVLFGRKDANKNVLLSSPSDFLVMTNPATEVPKTGVLQFSIPEEIRSSSLSYFFQVYRSSQSAADDISPAADFKLVIEQPLTSTDKTNGFVVFVDTILDIFLGAFLYTNENSQEGELQANDRPPFATDLTLFKGYMLYSNTRSRDKLLLDIVNVGNLQNGQYVTITKQATGRRLYALTGVANDLVTATSVSFASTLISVTYAAHGFSTGFVVNVVNAVGTGTLPSGNYTITVTGANTFDFTAASAPTTLTSLDFEGVSNTGGFSFFKLETALSPAENIDVTARAFVKAINRNTAYGIYARYISDIAGVSGKMVLLGKEAFNDTTYSFTLTAETTLHGSGFFPALPTSGSTVISESDAYPHNISVSKYNEPAAVPATNSFFVGSQNSKIRRIVALRDSVIIFKDDGIFRLSGDSIADFSVTSLDTTVFLKADSSVVTLNNKAMALTTAGVVEVTDTAAAIVSRNIEIPIVAILTSDLASTTCAVAYESERLYILTTRLPNETTPTVVWVYNYVTQQWTNWDTFFKAAVVGSNDNLYYASTSSGKILRERKLQTKLDFCGQDYSLTVSSVSGTTVVFSGTSIIPEVGDVVVKSTFVNRITSVTVGLSSVTCTFKQTTDLVAADVVTLYSSYPVQIAFSPIHAGSPTRNKHFATFQAVFRSPSCSSALLTFANEKFGSSESVTWTNYDQGNVGWGFEPWGTFPWGEGELINLDYTTLPNLQIRTYIPRLAGRGTYLKPMIEHNEAAEDFFLQAIGIAMRGYSERTTK
jgi:hypothetical protein